jgi:ABC-type transport system involved in multi-copper enzyme maturation permease subunit
VVVWENPVLQRELVVNLRKSRGFVLLLAYVGALGLLVLAAWPAQQKLDLARPQEAQRLVNLFFLGQFVLVSLMAPSFAAGALTGEKERKSYEMLLASPLRPGAIVAGKLGASLIPLFELMICSLPIVMLCLPLGGVSPYEVLAAYLAMISAVGLFGMISLWCSSYFERTSASLLVSYLLILPLALAGALLWSGLARFGEARLAVIVLGAPLGSLAAGGLLARDLCRRLIQPPELGSEGKRVIDLETEAEQAVGLYIKRDEFPDRLFAPPKRTTFLEDGANPIYDKEIRSEIFSQGTLMLRLVIQISMLLVLFVMAVCLFWKPLLAPWYVAYVLLFNLLVGPVFSAGSVTSERERETLDLLLTTLISPWQMLWGKLLSGLRVSSVLTAFLMWPALLSCVLQADFWPNLPTMLGYFVIVAITAVTTSLTALCCSTLLHKSSTSLVVSYATLGTLFLAPLAAGWFVDEFVPESAAAPAVRAAEAASPFAAAFRLPLTIDERNNADVADVRVFAGFVVFGAAYNAAVLGLIIWLFGRRWRVAE